jgi:hypothetical protein
MKAVLILYAAGCHPFATYFHSCLAVLAVNFWQSVPPRAMGTEGGGAAGRRTSHVHRVQHPAAFVPEGLVDQAARRAAAVGRAGIPGARGGAVMQPRAISLCCTS